MKDALDAYQKEVDVWETMSQAQKDVYSERCDENENALCFYDNLMQDGLQYFFNETLFESSSQTAPSKEKCQSSSSVILGSNEDSIKKIWTNVEVPNHIQ